MSTLRRIACTAFLSARIGRETGSRRGSAKTIVGVAGTAVIIRVVPPEEPLVLWASGR
ncbi:MAG: hypothetical protein AABZ12_07770 [Planctomycetota bacterium]